jgi:hypothetical protein
MRHHPLNTPIGRFRVETMEDDADGCLATMPLTGFVSPVTGLPSLAPLSAIW